MSEPETKQTPKGDRRRRRGGNKKKVAAEAADGKSAAPAASSEKPTLKKILNDMNKQINPSQLSEQDRNDLSSMLQKILNKLGNGGKGAKGAKAAASNGKVAKAEKKPVQQKAPREPVDISQTLLPALMSGLQSFVAYLDAQMAAKDPQAPKTPSLAAQLASMRRSPAVDALNEAQRGQVLNILVGSTVLLTQRLSAVEATLPPKPAASQTADGKPASALTPEQRRQLRQLRPALHLLVAASAHIRQPTPETKAVNVDNAVIQVAAQSFGPLSRSLNLLDFLSLAASMSFSLARVNTRAKALAGTPADQKLNEVAAADGDVISSLLSDKQVRICVSRFARLPKRAAIRFQLASFVDGVELPKRQRRGRKDAAASAAASSETQA